MAFSFSMPLMILSKAEKIIVNSPAIKMSWFYLNSSVQRSVQVGVNQRYCGTTLMMTKDEMRLEGSRQHFLIRYGFCLQPVQTLAQSSMYNFNYDFSYIILRNGHSDNNKFISRLCKLPENHFLGFHSENVYEGS